MNPKGRVDLTADVSANVLRLSFHGEVTVREMALNQTQMSATVEKLKVGFSLVTDFTELQKMDVDCTPYIERTMELMKSKGVGLVVRVIPDRTKDIGINIISLFHYPRRLKIVTTETRAEAAAIVAQSKPSS